MKHLSATDLMGSQKVVLSGTTKTPQEKHSQRRSQPEQIPKRKSVELPPTPHLRRSNYNQSSAELNQVSRQTNSVDGYYYTTENLGDRGLRNSTGMKVTARSQQVSGSAVQDHVPASKTRQVVSGKRSSKQGRSRRQHSGYAKSILYGLRLTILGVGIGVLAGTLLSILDPTSRITAGTPNTLNPEVTQPEKITAVFAPSVLKLTQEVIPLKTSVQQLAAKQAKLLPGVFMFDLDTGAYLDINGDLTFAAASMIKVPILVAFFQDVDAGKIRLDEKLTLTKAVIGSGSGGMQYQPLGTKFTALDTATQMIIHSDNTATNMIIARLGGIAALNQRFHSWGLKVTQLHNPLPDLAGTNTTSPRDLANLMGLVNQGELMSLRSRDRLLDIMRRTVTNTLLPRGLGKGATIAHKTGDIGSLVGDVGLIDMPSGKRYIAVAMVRRPHNDSRAQELIRQISRTTYQAFSKPSLTEVMPTTGFVSITTRRAN